MRVFGARCIVKEAKKESNKTSSGIVIPGSDKEPTYRGKVIAVGQGAILENGQRVPMDVKVDDEVIYTAFSGTPIETKEGTFIILNERDILAVVD